MFPSLSMPIGKLHLSSHSSVLTSSITSFSKDSTKIFRAKFTYPSSIVELSAKKSSRLFIKCNRRIWVFSLYVKTSNTLNFEFDASYFNTINNRMDTVHFREGRIYVSKRYEDYANRYRNEIDYKLQISDRFIK